MKSALRAALTVLLAVLSLVGMSATATATPTPGSLGDGTGDGIADIWSTISPTRYYKYPKNGYTTVYRGVVTQFKAGPSIGWLYTTDSNMGLSTASQIMPLPDMTGDKKADLMARFGDHLYLYKNTGNGTVARSYEIGHGWAGYDTIFYAGHLNGGTDRYLLARRTTDMSLQAFKLGANGAVTSTGATGYRWGGMKFLLAPGDMTGDGKDDLMGIDAKGDMWCYRSVGSSHVQGVGQCGSGWTGFTKVFVAGDMDGDGRADIVGQQKTTHPGTSCDSRGICDPVEKLCAKTTADMGAYASEYEVAPSDDHCVALGDKYRLKRVFRTPMYVYRNLGAWKLAAPKMIGWDMFMYTESA